jgi:septum formation protein
MIALAQTSSQRLSQHSKAEGKMATREYEPNLILASQSPRRRYLLEQAGVTFSVIPSDFDEASVQITNPSEMVVTLAKAKADEIAVRHPDAWVIGADTIVTINGSILGKPDSHAEARKMLRKLSGQAHFVFTGFAIVCKKKQVSIADAVQTQVTFKRLTDPEIDWYIQTGEPFDKAGAYAVQGIGTFLVKRINGSYTNVVGLPVCEVVELLIQLGVVNFNRKNGKGL